MQTLVIRFGLGRLLVCLVVVALICAGASHLGAFLAGVGCTAGAVLLDELGL